MNDLTPWTPSRRGFLGLAAAATAGLALSACGTASTPNEKPKSSGSGGAAGGTNGNTGTPRKGESGEMLLVAGFQWGPPTNFNPIGPSPAWPSGGGQHQLIYESLVRWNMLDGSFTKGLGTEIKSVDETTMEVPLSEGTKWADGQDLTADDVVFTYQLAKDNQLSYSNVWEYLDSVTAKDPRTVQFKLKKAKLNPGTVRASIAGTLILPKHIWSKIDKSKLQSEPNLKPVGSGPFEVDKADNTQIIVKRRDDYWGKTLFGTPAMKAIAHPIFKGNQDGDLALASNQVDASQQFTAQIWKMWQDQKKPVGTWLKDKPYYLPGGMPSLLFNLETPGLKDVNVRKAIAHAINFPDISAKAMSSYSDAIQASLIVPKGSEEKFFDKAAAEKNGWTYDPKKAEKILTDAGATKGSDGIYKLKDGTRLGPWKLITPAGWTDWNTSCEIIAKSLKAIGIDVSTNFPEAPTAISAIQNGNFELAHYNYSGVGPASPWSRFRDALDDRGVPPVGKTAFQNYGRFKNAEVPKLLDEAGAATDDAKAKAAYAKLDDIFRENVPFVPVMYRPLEFYEFNSSTWTNFPTEANPYAPPTWSGSGIEWMFKLKKA